MKGAEHITMMMRLSLIVTVSLMMFGNPALAFAPIASSVSKTQATAAATTSLHMMDVGAIQEVAGSGLLLAETEAWVQPLSLVLDPFLNLLSFAMLCRVVISWYPQTNLNELPFNVVAWPTEPLLRLIRGVVPPAFGVDITPIVWLGFFTFLHEILLGQQGLLTMKIKYGI